MDIAILVYVIVLSIITWKADAKANKLETKLAKIKARLENSCANVREKHHFADTAPKGPEQDKAVIIYQKALSELYFDAQNVIK